MNMTNDENAKSQVWHAALAGLLHDVGKFSQRAGIGKSEAWDKDAREQIKYVHALYSYDFLNEFVPEKWRADLSGIAYHHQPRNLSERWIQIADWLSSAERSTGEDEDENSRAPFLQSVFSRVELNGKRAERTSYWHLTRLDVNDKEKLFPSQSQDKDWRDCYFKLWEEFVAQCRQREITANSTLTLTAYLENLLGVLQEFAWCMPSAYWKNVPDVSLYDHLRTTAAIAACIAADERNAEWCDAIANKQAREVALLVVGDFSGIQKFIYTLTSSGAAKSLRARSFYLQLLSEIVALNLLDALGVPLTNLIYVGGGKFYLLAPVKAHDALPTLAQQLTDKLMKTHQGALGLTLEWTTVHANEFERCNEVYDRLGKNLSRKKRQPFAQASSNELAKQIGMPLTQGGIPEKVCAVTGDDWELDEERFKRDGEWKTRFVWSLEELGRALPNATHLILRRVQNAPSVRPRNWQEALRQFGFDVTVVQGDKLSANDNAELARVWRIDPQAPNDAQQIRSALNTAQVVFAEHPTAKLTPRNERGEVITFDELAENAQGIKRWGVLRMDVDNLGELFRTGLGKEASISRVSSLSFGLRLFFEGWLPRIADEEKEVQNKLYLQYAGGDDLFVVGAWDALPKFAMRVRDSFREFTGQNPAFGVSGGIVIVESKFPLYQAAQLADDAEHMAKHWRGNDKDAIAFLDDATDWKTFETTMHNANELADWRRTNQVPASLLQTIMSLRAQIKQAEARAKRNSKDKPRYGRWMWMAAYQLKRAEDTVKREHPEIKKRIEQIQSTFLVPGDASEEWGRAARWAQYLSRGGE